MPSQNYHHENLKSELIREGLVILDKEGYEGFSLRKVAKACNVSHTAPYRHFKNKDELITAIIMEALQAFSQSLDNAVLKYPDDPTKQLKEMGISYIRFFSENPEYLHLLFSNDIFNKLGTAGRREDEEICIKESNSNSGHPFATFYKAVENYAGASKNNFMEQDELVLYCWGLVHGISILISNKNNLPFQGDYLELVEKIIWNNKFLE